MTRDNLAPTLWCLVAAALFGASTPLSKPLLSSLGPFSLAGLLYLGAAAAVLPFARGAVPSDQWARRANKYRLAGTVVAGGVLGPVLLLSGLAHSTAASVSLWLNLETPATALLAVVFFREHVGWRMWWAIALVSAASIVLLWPAGFAAASAAALVALACVCWGIDNNLTALIDGFTLTQSTFVKGVAAGTLNLALGLWFEPNIWRAPTLTTALFVGALSYGLSLVLHIAGAQHLGAARAQTVFGTAPFWGVALSWIMLGEPRAPEQVLAGGLMIVALWVMRTEQHGHTHTHIAAAHTHWHRHDDGHHEHTHPELAPGSWHSHEHAHEAGTHEHDHAPDLHHRHGH